MAIKRSPQRANKAQDDASAKRCRDCALSYDWHSKALDGHLILARCPHKFENGKFCIFLSDKACELFKQRNQKEGEQNNG